LVFFAGEMKKPAKMAFFCRGNEKACKNGIIFAGENVF